MDHEAPAAVPFEVTEPAHDRTARHYARADAEALPAHVVAAHKRRRTGASEAAFFDLDKTLIARSSTFAFGRTFMKDGLISPTMVLKGMYAQAVYQLVGADHDRMEQMRHAMLELTRGWEAERIRRLVHETMEQVVAPLVFQEALDLFDEHRTAGRDLWVVSTSGDEIVTPFAAYLGIRNVIATVSGVDADGRYDGTLEFYAYAANKAEAIRQVAAARGYDLSGCHAYSDSITDLPMLSVVGHPTAVNPDRQLRAAATAMGWPIRDFISPVSLRHRLPSRRPSRHGALLGAATAAAAAGLVAWRTRSQKRG